VATSRGPISVQLEKPSLLRLARTAQALPPFGPNGVFFIVWVPTGALGFLCIECGGALAPQAVLSGCDRLHMLGPHATVIAA